MKRIIGHKYTVIIVSLLMVLFIFVNTNLPYAFFAGIILAFATVWANEWKWDIVGIKKPANFVELLWKALLWAMGIVVFSVITIPVLEQFFGTHDLSSFDLIRGNSTAYLFFLLQIWLFVAFFEEFAFRGYLMLQIERLLGHNPKAAILAVLLSSILFGICHNYQGLTGIILTGTIGGILGISYYANKRNLWMPILIHGFVDTIYITLVYTNFDIKMDQVLTTLF